MAVEHIDKFTFSPVEMLLLPSASRAERAPTPTEGKTGKHSRIIRILHKNNFIVGFILVERSRKAPKERRDQEKYKIASTEHAKKRYPQNHICNLHLTKEKKVK